MATFRDDQVSVFFGWLDKRFMHGFNCTQILMMDRLDAPSTFFNISKDPAENTYIRIGIYEYLDVEHFTEILVRKDVESLNDYNIVWLQLYRLCSGAGMDCKVIHGSECGLFFAQRFKMLNEQLVIESERMIVINGFTFSKAEM